jgi:hypothetical protein
MSPGRLCRKRTGAPQTMEGLREEGRKTRELPEHAGCFLWSRRCLRLQARHKIVGPAKPGCWLRDHHDHVGWRPPPRFARRQRTVIARAIALQPKLLILDEPVSALDLSIRSQILDLLLDLQQRFGLSYLFISHDLSVVRNFADRVAVMYLGRLADRRCFFRAGPSLHGGLLSAVPLPDPVAQRRRRRIIFPVLTERLAYVRINPNKPPFDNPKLR